MKSITIISLLVAALIAGSWVTNLVKLFNCDFEGPYRCEVIHAAGILPPVALVTAWLPSDATKD